MNVKHVEYIFVNVAVIYFISLLENLICADVEKTAL